MKDKVHARTVAETDKNQKAEAKLFGVSFNLFLGFIRR